VLRQLIVLFLSKLVGRNTTPLLLTVAAQARDGRCTLEFRWKSNIDAQVAVHDAKNILAKELMQVEEMVRSIGGELALSEKVPEITLKVPAALDSIGGRQELLH
jgi:hypothetical protein